MQQKSFFIVTFIFFLLAQIETTEQDGYSGYSDQESKQLDSNHKISKLNSGLLSVNNVPISDSKPLSTLKSSLDSKKDFASSVDKILEDIIALALALGGAYVLFSGVRAYRFTMMINGLFVSYYGILFTMVELEKFDGNNVGHQLGLFFGSLILGFIISVLCYAFDRLNYFIFSATISSMVCLFLAQYFLDLFDPDNRLIIVGVFVGATIVFTIFAFFVLDHFIIWGCSFVGAVISATNVGIFIGMLVPFENRKKGKQDASQKVKMTFVITIGALMACGLVCQYFLRRRMVKKFQNQLAEDENENRRTFLV